MGFGAVLQHVVHETMIIAIWGRLLINNNLVVSSGVVLVWLEFSIWHSIFTIINIIYMEPHTQMCVLLESSFCISNNLVIRVYIFYDFKCVQHDLICWTYVSCSCQRPTVLCAGRGSQNDIHTPIQHIGVHISMFQIQTCYLTTSCFSNFPNQISTTK